MRLLRARRMYPTRNQFEYAQSLPPRALQIQFRARPDEPKKVPKPIFPRLREESRDPNRLRKHKHSRREETPRRRPQLLLVRRQGGTGAQEWSAHSTQPVGSLRKSHRSAPQKTEFAGAH